MTSPTIKQRVQRIAHVLTWSPRSWDEPADLSENLVDLLADARHWCDRNAQCFAALDRKAYQNYLADLNQPERNHDHEEPNA